MIEDNKDRQQYAIERNLDPSATWADINNHELEQMRQICGPALPTEDINLRNNDEFRHNLALELKHPQGKNASWAQIIAHKCQIAIQQSSCGAEGSQTANAPDNSVSDHPAGCKDGTLVESAAHLQSTHNQIREEDRRKRDEETFARLLRSLGQQ